MPFETGSRILFQKMPLINLVVQLAERFARFEALLSRGNIFTSPEIHANVVPPPFLE